MTTLAAPVNGSETSNPDSPVPLDTIPISPADGSHDENTAPNGAARKQYKETEEITVFHDPENFTVKHPLMNKWTLWFTKPASTKVSAVSLRWTSELTLLKTGTRLE
jgi:translation initiation factor 4E